MKIIITAILVFLGAMVADGIILPSLFHIYGSFLAMAFLAALLVVYSDDTKTLTLLVIAAFALELWHGYYFFSVILAALAAAALWQWLRRFFNIFSFLPLLGVGYVLIIVMNIIFVAVEKYIYRAPVAWSTLGLAATSLTIWVTTGLGLAACMLLMRLPGYKATPASGKFYI